MKYIPNATGLVYKTATGMKSVTEVAIDKLKVTKDGQTTIVFSLPSSELFAGWFFVWSYMNTKNIANLVSGASLYLSSLISNSNYGLAEYMIFAGIIQRIASRCAKVDYLKFTKLSDNAFGQSLI